MTKILTIAYSQNVYDYFFRHSYEAEVSKAREKCHIGFYSIVNIYEYIKDGQRMRGSWNEKYFPVVNN